MQYSVRLEGQALQDNMQIAYDRAERNAARAEDLAVRSNWLWGEEASYEDYAAQDRLHHQLTGEIDALGRGYRSEAYALCTDPIAKELIPDFPGFVHFSAQRYLEASQDILSGGSERTIALDHAKQYALTLFHAAQYPARSRLLDTDEYHAVGRLGQAAEHATRAFYASVLGWDRDYIDTETVAAAALLQDPTVSDHVASLPVSQFKRQELDQPLTVLMSSLLAANLYPETEIIYALPSGGTQHAIVTRMMFERLRGTDGEPALQYLPISTHSAKPEALNGLVSPSVEFAVRQTDPSDRHVLICEDNSNTGTTVSLAADVIAASFPASCHVSMVEFDPKRLEVKNRNLQPTGHVANYQHADYDTAVGIVPVTVGRYPDAQMRKVMTLRHQRHLPRQEAGDIAGIVTEYDQLPKDFLSEFTDIYKQTLRYCGDLHGYRNPYQVAAAMVRHYQEYDMLADADVMTRYNIAQHIARATIEYPYMPNEVRIKLATGQETLDYRPDGPWIRAGATGLMRQLVGYAAENDSRVLIWTKGDGSYYSNPPYVGAEEQQLRFTISGLESRLRQDGFFDSGYGSFLAHPKKAPLLGTRVLPDLRQRSPHVTDLVIIDDAEKNLAEASQEARRFGYVPHPINPLIGDTGRTRLALLTEYARSRHWGPNTAFIVDMDDTLLHEGFRKFHQPRNMALALLNATAHIER